MLLASLLVAFSGCATTTGTTAGTIAALGGTAFALDVASQSSDPNQSVEKSAPQLYVAGAILLVTLIAAGVAVEAEATAPDDPTPIAVARPTPVAVTPPIDASGCEPRAAQLTRQARLAAELGQCTAVSSFGERVNAIDRRCHTNVFVTDATIGHCFARD